MASWGQALVRRRSGCGAATRGVIHGWRWPAFLRAGRGEFNVSHGSRLPPGTFETVQGVIALTSEGFLGAAQPGGNGTVDTLPEGGDGSGSAGFGAAGSAARTGAARRSSATSIPRTRREKTRPEKMPKVLSNKRLTTSDIFSSGGESELTLDGGGRYIQRRCGCGRPVGRPASHAAKRSNSDCGFSKPWRTSGGG
jgi:hypothetical protein